MINPILSLCVNCDLSCNIMDKIRLLKVIYCLWGFFYRLTINTLLGWTFSFVLLLRFTALFYWQFSFLLSDDPEAVYELGELAALVSKGGVDSVLTLHLHVDNIIKSTNITGPHRWVNILLLLSRSVLFFDPFSIWFCPCCFCPGLVLSLYLPQCVFCLFSRSCCLSVPISLFLSFFVIFSIQVM